MLEFHHPAKVCATRDVKRANRAPVWLSACGEAGAGGPPKFANGPGPTGGNQSSATSEKQRSTSLSLSAGRLMADSRSWLSPSQIEALQALLHHRLVRAAMDWVFLEEVALPLDQLEL
jgi:hypothetical protein